MNNTNISKIIIDIGVRLKLVKEGHDVKVCNFSNNYYGDQQCCDVSKVRLSLPSS